MAIVDDFESEKISEGGLHVPPKEKKAENIVYGNRRAIDLTPYQMFQDRTRYLTLSPEGTQFVENLKKLGNDIGEGYKFEIVKGDKIECILVSHPSAKCGFLLGFAESTDKSKIEIPAAYHFLEVKKALNKERPELNILNSIIVGPEEYSRFQLFYMNISMHFDNYLNLMNMSLNIKQFENYEIVVKSNDFVGVEEMMRKKYPHAVIPRMDVASTIRIVPANLMKTEEYVPMAYMTGYTDFIGQRPGVFEDRPLRFNPLFHMELYSSVPDPAIFAFVVAPIIDLYIRRKEWLKVYDSYGPDDINIGCLIPTERNGITPWRAANKEERNDFLKKYMNLNALPILDVFGGKMQLPLINYFASDEKGMISFIERIGKFFNITDLNTIPVPVLNYNLVNHTGVITADTMVDSRKVDYLYLANKTNTISNLDKWLNYQDDDTRAKLLGGSPGGLFPNKFENRYYNFMKVINPAFVTWVSHQFSLNNISVSYDGMKFDDMFATGKFNEDMFKSWELTGFSNIQKTTEFGGLGISSFTY